MSKGRVTTKGNADMLKKWVNRNLSTLKKDKCKVLQLGKNKKYRLREAIHDWLGSN